MDFAAFLAESGSVFQVGTEWALVAGANSFTGDQDLFVSPPTVNGMVVYCVVSRGVVGSTYRLSYFVNDGQKQDIQLTGYLVIVPDVLSDVLSVQPPPPPVVVPAPTVTLAASPTILSGSGSVTLTWTSTDATSVVASGGWNGNLALSGAQSSGTLTSTTTFTVTAMGPGGGPVTASVTVTVNPVVVPPLFAAHVHVTAKKTTGMNQYGFFITPAGDGSVSPANLPSGGSALGLAIQAIYSESEGASVGANAIELGIMVAPNDNVTPTNQFDSVSVVDDSGATRTFTSAGATYAYVGPGETANTWMWTGPDLVMQTDGKTYDFLFTKVS